MSKRRGKTTLHVLNLLPKDILQMFVKELCHEGIQILRASIGMSFKRWQLHKTACRTGNIAQLEWLNSVGVYIRHNDIYKAMHSGDKLTEKHEEAIIWMLAHGYNPGTEPEIIIATRSKRIINIFEKTLIDLYPVSSMVESVKHDNYMLFSKIVRKYAGGVSIMGKSLMSIIVNTPHSEKYIKLLHRFLPKGTLKSEKHTAADIRYLISYGYITSGTTITAPYNLTVDDYKFIRHNQINVRLEAREYSPEFTSYAYEHGLISQDKFINFVILSENSISYYIRNISISYEILIDTIKILRRTAKINKQVGKNICKLIKGMDIVEIHKISRKNGYEIIKAMSNYKDFSIIMRYLLEKKIITPHITHIKTIENDSLAIEVCKFLKQDCIKYAIKNRNYPYPLIREIIKLDYEYYDKELFTILNKEKCENIAKLL